MGVVRGFSWIGCGTFADIEVADQVLTCVDKMSEDAPMAILQHDGVSAILTYLDFFCVATQRKALSCVSNVCRKVKPATYNNVKSSLPLLRNYLHHDDTKIMEHALNAINRIVQNMQRESSLIQHAFSECAPALLDLIEKRPSESIFSTALQLLCSAVTGSPEVAENLIELGAVTSLSALLSIKAGTSLSMSNMSHSPDTSAPTGATPMKLSSGVVGGVGDSSFTPPNTPSTTYSPVASIQKSVGVEQLKDVCNALVGFLPQIQDGYFPYLSKLSSITTTTNSGGPASHTAETAGGGWDPANRAELEAMVQEGIVAVHNDPKHKATLWDPHTCNLCSQAVSPVNWFRCNLCADFDSCIACLVSHGDEHGNPMEHPFTDMQALVDVGATESTGRAENNVTDESGGLAKTPRSDMFEQKPFLLERLCEALPTVVRLLLDSEHPIVRSLCLTFIARAVHFGSSSHSLRSSRNSPRCPSLRNNLHAAQR